MWVRRRRTRRRRRVSKVFAGLLITACLALAAAVTESTSRRENRATTAALASLARTNAPAAWSYAIRAVQLNSNSVAASRVLAEIADRSNSVDALHWRQRVAQLEPDQWSNQLALARTALKMDQVAIVKQALALLPDDRLRTNREYHLIAAQSAFLGGDVDAAQAHLQRVVQSEPDNCVHRHNLHILELHSSEPRTVEEAQRALERDADEPRHAVAILSALTREAFARRDYGHALEFSKRLQRIAGVSFADRLLHLTILQEKQSAAEALPSPPPQATTPIMASFSSGETNPVSVLLPRVSCEPPPEVSAFLQCVEREASLDPERAGQLLSWLNQRGMSQTGLHWLETLSHGVRDAACVRLAEAQCHLSVRNWSRLRQVLAQSDWESEDYLRHAILSLASRQQGEEKQAHLEWKAAVDACQDDLVPKSQALVRFTAAWGWEEEAEELLWQLVAGKTSSGWALGVLRHAYEMTGNTRALLRVFTEVFRQEPDNLTAKNNFAATCLLLGKNLTTAHHLAREIYAEHPANAATACTYAFSLHLQGRNEEALDVLAAYQEEISRNSSLAAYYATLLASRGLTSEAQKYVTLARSGFLLPEEKALVDLAEQNR